MATSGYTDVKFTSWDTLRFNWALSSQSVANNTSTITWNLQLISGEYGRINSTASKAWSVTVNGTTYSGKNTIGIGNNATKVLASGTTTIAHNSDGTKTFSYSFSQEMAITFSGVYIGTKSGSGSGTLTTIPRKSTLSVGNGTLGTAQALTVTKQATSFTHTITYKCGSASGTIATKSSATSISFTPPLTLANQGPKATSLSITYTITTYNGNTNIGSNTYTKTLSIPASIVPTISLSVSDAMGYASKYGGYIQGVSKIKGVITANGVYGSEIYTYYTTADGKAYANPTFTSEPIANSGTLTINASAKDSRGRSASTSKTITVHKYSSPLIEGFGAYRVNEAGEIDEQGEYIIVSGFAKVTHLNEQVMPTIVLEYKKLTETTKTQMTLDVGETSFEDIFVVGHFSKKFEADPASSYEITLKLSDNFKEISKNATITTAKKFYSIKEGGKGVALNKYAELEDVFDIGFKTRFSGGLMPLVIPANTDVDDLLEPNWYIGMEAEEAGYINLPFSSNSSFVFEILSAGEVGQLMQRCTICRKTAPVVYERFYYASSWGEWVKVSDFGGTLLWSGSYYMSNIQKATLAEKVSEQATGIVLVFSEYVDGAPADQSFHEIFVPKYMVESHAGDGHVFQLSTSNLAYFATKYLHISDDVITGHDNNTLSGTSACGIKYTNNRFVLRYVIGV